LKRKEKMDASYAAPAVTPPAPLVAAQPPKGILGMIKQHKWIVIGVLAVVLWFVYQKWSKKNPPAQQAVQLIQPVQVPQPPPAVDPNFTRLTPPTTA